MLARLCTRLLLRSPALPARLLSSTSHPSLLPINRGADRIPHLTASTSYEHMLASYTRPSPRHYNMGYDVCDKHVLAGHGDDTALIYVPRPTRKGASLSSIEPRTYTFSDLQTLSNRLANALTLHDKVQVVTGDRVAVYLAQSPETAVTHLAVYRLGGVVLPLFKLFGPEAVRFRLLNSATRCVVTDEEGLEVLLQVVDDLPDLETIIVTRSELAGARKKPALPDGVLDFEELVAAGSSSFECARTAAEDPALIVYTSGTTGTPKGCVHAHRVLLGHMPGVELPHDFFPHKDDLFWTPADWAWVGGLLDVLLPSWHHRIPVLAHRFEKFDPDEAFHLMKRFNVKNTFMPATALKLLRKGSQQKHQLRSLGSGGETLGEELLAWGRETFGVRINEFYGQTECNLIISNCASCFPIRPGSMGRAVPGKDVAIVDPDGNPLPDGETGDVAVKRPDLTMFKGYWRNEEATEAKFRGDYLLTGDQAKRDEDGYFWFVGRDDDIICSAGYRIGPGEVEDCLIQHPKVALAAAVGKPDPTRTEIVKAFVVLHDGETPSAELASDIQAFVRKRLAAYEYPREVEFIAELPMTTTGKVIRKDLRDLEVRRAEEAAAGKLFT